MADRIMLIEDDETIALGVVTALKQNYEGVHYDNGEDAVIMTTDPILRLPFQQRFRELAEAHERRWGRADRVLY